MYADTLINTGKFWSCFCVPMLYTQQIHKLSTVKTPYKIRIFQCFPHLIHIVHIFISTNFTTLFCCPKIYSQTCGAMLYLTYKF